MSELLINRATGPLEPTGDGWTVDGLAVPYGVPQEVSDDGGATTYLEAFQHGAFTRDCQKGGRWVNLMVGHFGDEGDRFLGRCIGLREAEAGLFASFRLDRSHPEAEAARAGELTGWSVSTRVYRSTSIATAIGERVVYREACGLSHVAATMRPQYAGAGVLVARDHTLTVAPSATPRRDAHREWLDRLPKRA
jgi:HK97 family phage prohead protease